MAALTPATQPRPQHTARASVIGAIVAAIAASACCILPAVLAVVGLSGAGLAAAFEPYRPVLLGATVLLLGVGFYLTYRRPRLSAASCEAACGVCTSPRVARSGTWMLWIATVMVALFAAYPYIAGAGALTSATGTTARTANAATARIRVGGMTCKGCSTGIVRDLAKLDGVVEARVEYEQGYAVVTYDPDRVTSDALVAVIANLGYTAVIEKLGA